MTESFPMIPASARLLWWLGGFLAVIFAGLMTLMLATARGATTSRFAVSSQGIRLHGDVYGRLVPVSAIRASDVRIVDMHAEPGLEPVRRTMGTAVPGYNSGWYRLRNGRKALLYLTDRRRAVYVPTTLGYDLLISPQEPDRFVDALKSVGSGL
jgi:hypothetical protein